MFGANVKLEDVKRNFFDRKAVTDALSRGSVKAFNRIGGLTRRIARNSIRPISKRLLKQVTLKRLEMNKYKKGSAKRAKAEQELRALSRAAHSQPGKPPKSITGHLKNGIFYSYDSHKETVVTGALLLNKSTGAQEVLEHGGQANIGPRRVDMAARPYMGPAGKKVESQAAGFFRDCMEKQ